MAVSNALSTALQGLLVQQHGLNVTGHNIANANTPGFSRQRAELVPALPDYFQFGAVGRGVEVRGIERVVEDFLLQQQRDATSQASGDQTLMSVYNRLEVFFNELSDNDLSTAFPVLTGYLEAHAIAWRDETTRRGDALNVPSPPDTDPQTAPAEPAYQEELRALGYL